MGWMKPADFHLNEAIDMSARIEGYSPELEQSIKEGNGFFSIRLKEE